ncbi:hypothetical protein NQ318_000974 [Aromia moschata]|uniref:Uncharacterized protein n=1 Tax=Aromia moschata TaxID=1265417 RepID=A0AAV8ZFR4_9CUCU|nr:hypothetical protein NQ318_000974 [Aromia moschata]
MDVMKEQRRHKELIEKSFILLQIFKYEVCKLSNETGNVAPDLATLRTRDLDGRSNNRLKYAATGIPNFDNMRL